MDTLQLLNRSYGLTGSNNVVTTTGSRLTYTLQFSPDVTFRQTAPSKETPNEQPIAHPSGVNCLAIDHEYQRFLLSGGTDSSIAMWDLESPSTYTSPDGQTHTYHTPLEFTPNTAEKHNLGITTALWFPTDSDSFLTSSYDHTVKIYNPETMSADAVFDMSSIVYNISMSPIASHFTIACATQEPLVRLIDLRSGAHTHGLAGHTAAVLSTAWSPTREHILASGSVDGSVRFWDIRRAGDIGILDFEDSVGVLAPGRPPANPYSRIPSQKKAHQGPVNGLVWTEDGHHLITCGHDARICVWDTDTAANTHANFGPLVRNSGHASRIPVLVPKRFTPLEKDILWFPNGGEILGFELFEGELVRRLKRPVREAMPNEVQTGAGLSRGGRRGRTGASKAVPVPSPRDRITCLAWRPDNIEMYSSHADGSIVAWKPRTAEDVELDEEEQREKDEREDSRKRKRGVLEDIYQDLTRQKITFGGKW